MNESYFKKKNKLCFTILISIFILCFVISFMIGKYPINPIELIKVLLSPIVPITPTWKPEVETIIFQVRLPRVIAAVLIGSALSAAGAAYQGLFRNPMVSPDVLGASAGAGFGAALGIFCSFSYFGISISSFLFGILTVTLVYIISIQVRNNPILGLVLTGIMVGSLFSSGTSFLKLMADPDNVLPAITYWLMGSLASIRREDVIFAIVPILIGLIPLFLLRWKLNVLTMGEEEAQTIGINTGLTRIIIVLCATLVTSASVSISGMIGWVGLVIPHFARMIVGYDYRVMLPASMLMGGSYLLMVDNIARTISTSEIPIGILTAFVGAPFFVYLILREGKKS
ncbi:FecCD family ABC transporter permease [Clostridium cylindrosporum]|uniref:ABC-type Fe3+-siderophore transport system, permease component n=1 Tax=Clostridium cylindrosporum DSM 605 TaxID=1121307 RepID=A0A0J8DBY4_CLOCY|nr:iron ABC transporter permease [Clostridium cylindrosporum]KMT21793.1 ABC-type Fe3+-siderophore transport system, permease component [Clostridium cylindrosporum DSM 605]